MWAIKQLSVGIINEKELLSHNRRYYMLITKKSVAKILSVSSSTIYRWSRDGTIPQPIVIGPNKTVWLKTEIEEFIKLKEKKKRFWKTSYKGVQ